MKILIIDDDVKAAVNLQTLLNQRGYYTDVVYNGKDGLSKMITDPSYNLLILDVMMPEFSGIDVVKAMSKNKSIKNIPVLLASSLPITSRELSELLNEFKSFCSLRGVLEKPFIIDDLIIQINKIS